ncbi:hypothetical protein EXU57_03330 [Segetibacter sp. 3557_3]|uniref:hypothetical protein n=1 Tax=Segetibacter sp. 3557_3 TaxID=2547429 RepID=UPI001058A066|nr:hypothetical protein [Segetibacter sp. 3557_3]TDH29112.1 hypothetical protein EXU57_03330 [Segetibacter sp. 3557_3]
MKKAIVILSMGVVFTCCNTPNQTDQSVGDTSRMSTGAGTGAGTDTSGTTAPDTTRPVPDTVRPDTIPRGL